MLNRINEDKIKDLNLDVSLASANLQLVKQIPITDVNDIFCCLLLSNTAKKLYNSALYLFKKQYRENQTTLNCNTLDKLMKNEELHPNFAKLYKDLTAKVSQQVLKLFSQNIKSFFALKQSEKLTEEQKIKVNLPRYYAKNGLAPIYYTNQALSRKSFNEEGVVHFAGTDLKIKLDFPEITQFSQINQVRIIPSTRNDKNKSLSDLLNEYCSSDNDQTSYALPPLFKVEIVYTAPLNQQRKNNQSLNLRYETKIVQKVRKKDNTVYEIKKEELVEVSYTEEFLRSVAGIDQNLDQLAIGIVTDNKTTAFTYDIKYLKSVNQYWNKQKAKLQEEISKQEKLLEDLKDKKIIEGDSSKSDNVNVKNIEADIKDKKVLIKQLKNKIKRITTKRNRKIDNYVHQLSRKLINHLSQLGVKNIVYGKNVNFKQEINLGKVTNQNFVNIPFNLIIERLRYKACFAGINFMTVEESYTSKTSFLDKEKLHSYKCDKAPQKYNFLGSRFTRSLFRSKNGHVIHADINASFNIIRKVSGDNIYDFINIGAIKVSSPKRWKINIQ